LQYVVVDECHNYRGVFGSHVAQVLRRLRRIAAYHLLAGHPSGRGRVDGGTAGHAPGPADAAGGSITTAPVFILASATVGGPGRCGGGRAGGGGGAGPRGGGARGRVRWGRWGPPLTALRGAAGAPVRRAATAEAAGLLAELVAAEVPALAFVRSRRGAEAV